MAEPTPRSALVPAIRSSAAKVASKARSLAGSAKAKVSGRSGGAEEEPAATDTAEGDDQLSPSGQVIVLDYPVHPRPRYGHGSPPHPGLLAACERSRQRAHAHMAAIAALAPWFRQIPTAEPSEPGGPCWVNGWMPGLDAATIYSNLVTRRPATYFEVGSGWSTRFARRAITDHDLDTRIVSVDPAPRAEVDVLCDEVHRVAFEDVDLAVFEELRPGDVVFVDNSHRCLQNSDATVFFLEALPRIGSGVLVGIHDMFVPEDYPIEWVDRFYSEQYVLSAFLLGEAPWLRVELPAWWAAHDPVLAAVAAPAFERGAPIGPDGTVVAAPMIERHGNGFWFTVERAEPAAAPG